MKVAVIGASNKPRRHSYQAVKLLMEKGHAVYPVHRKVKDIEGMGVYSSINDIDNYVDTVTMYVGADASDKLIKDIIAKKPKRIIFNPGAENINLEKKAQEQGIVTVKACTLVMLKTGQF